MMIWFHRKEENYTNHFIVLALQRRTATGLGITICQHFFLFAITQQEGATIRAVEDEGDEDIEIMSI